MQIPLHLTFKDVSPSPAVEAAVRKEADGLERYFDRITACRVVVSSPRRRQGEPTMFAVRVELATPGTDIHASKEHLDYPPGDGVAIAVREAFQAARRQLEDRVRVRRGDVKHHEEPPHGVVSKLFPADGHGFIRTPDGREIYFHRNSVIEGEFARLAVGDDVRYLEEAGREGPNATSVRVLGRQIHPA